MNKEQLIARAQELGITIPEGATKSDINNLIKLEEHPVLKKELKAVKDELEKTVEALAAAKEELAKVVVENTEDAKATYKCDHGTFVFTVENFRYKGEKYEVEEAVKNEELMEALIKAKFLHLKKA